MKRPALAILFLAAALAGCGGREPNPYRQQGNPNGQNPQGTPADRTGGSKNGTDDGAGGGRGKNLAPADQANPNAKK